MDKMRLEGCLAIYFLTLGGSCSEIKGDSQITLWAAKVLFHDAFQNLLSFIGNPPKWQRQLWGESFDPRWPEWTRIKRRRLNQKLLGPGGGIPHSWVLVAQAPVRRGWPKGQSTKKGHALVKEQDLVRAQDQVKGQSPIKDQDVVKGQDPVKARYTVKVQSSLSLAPAPGFWPNVPC